MKIKKLISLILMVSVCSTFFVACGNNGNTNTTSSSTSGNSTAVNEKSKTIVVIAKGESGGYWDNASRGAAEAAEKYGYTAVFRGTENELEAQAQKELIDKAIDENSSGIVLATVGDGFTEVLAKAYDKKVPVVQFDSGISAEDIKKLDADSKNPIISKVSTLNREAGAEVAEMFFAAIKGEIAKVNDKYVIGIVNGDASDYVIQRADGFKEKFSELADADEVTKGKYDFLVANEEESVKSLELLKEKNAKAVFITTEGAAADISDVVSRDADEYKNIIFCGFDSGAKQVEWLKRENSNFIGAVAQNAYDIGYNAVEQCIFAAEGKEVKDNIEVSVKWYDTSNLEKMLQENIVYE